MVECGDEPIVDAGDGAPTAMRQMPGRYSNVINLSE